MDETPSQMKKGLVRDLDEAEKKIADVSQRLGNIWGSGHVRFHASEIERMRGLLQKIDFHLLPTFHVLDDFDTIALKTNQEESNGN